MKCKSFQFKDFLESTHDNNTIYGFTETCLTEDESRDQWTHDKENLECFRRDRKIDSKNKRRGHSTISSKEFKSNITDRPGPKLKTC